MGLFDKKNKKKTVTAAPKKNIRKMTQNEYRIYAESSLNAAERHCHNTISLQLRMLEDKKDTVYYDSAYKNAQSVIKTAYYTLSMIAIMRERLSELILHNELARGVNELTEAVNMINRFATNAEKPKVNKLIRMTNKAEKIKTKEYERLASASSTIERSRVINVEQRVDDGIVDELLAGCDVDEFLRSGRYITQPYDPDRDIDYNDLDDGGGDIFNEPINIEFTDLRD